MRRQRREMRDTRGQQAIIIVAALRQVVPRPKKNPMIINDITRACNNCLVFVPALAKALAWHARPRACRAHPTGGACACAWPCQIYGAVRIPCMRVRMCACAHGQNRELLYGWCLALSRAGLVVDTNILPCSLSRQKRAVCSFTCGHRARARASIARAGGHRARAGTHRQRWRISSK